MSRDLKDFKQIVFYDGDCGLCDATVQWAIKRDTNNQLAFAPLGGETANKVQLSETLPKNLDSIITFNPENGQKLYYSDAIFAMTSAMPMPYPLLSIAKICPSFIRNAVYRYIARHRIQWFGRPDQCRLPSPETQRKLLA